MRVRSSNDVDPAEPLAQDVDGAAARVQLRRGQPQQGRLARAVGSEDDPALVQLDRPVDVGQQRRRHRGGPRHPSIRTTRSPDSTSGGVTPGGEQRLGGRSVGSHSAYPRGSCRLPVGCPCRARRSPFRGRLGQRRERRGVPGRRRAGGLHRAPGPADRAHVRGLARPPAGGRAPGSATATGCTVRTGRGRACGPTRRSCSSTRTPGRSSGAVTNLEAARGWAIDPMTGPPSTVDSLGHVPLSIVAAPAAPVGRPRRTSRGRETVILEVHVRGYTKQHPEVPRSSAAPTSASPTPRSSRTCAGSGSPPSSCSR